MASRKASIIGPFSGGLNTFDDPTAVDDDELVEALNFDSGLDGSLKSRPPFADLGTPLAVTGVGSPRLLGYFYDNDGSPFLIAADGDSSTYRYNNGTWTLITDTFSATDMTQFDGKAWLVSPVGEGSPGGSWDPTAGFVADSDMPRGTSITAYKSRLWIAEGVGGANPTRVRYSKVLGQPDFWQNAGFLDVGFGDGDSVIKIVTYFDSILAFRSKSIWSIQYGLDPGQAIQSVLVPGVGLQGKHAIVSYENYLYFMYDEKAYQFINNRVVQINLKVPFVSRNLGSTLQPYTVSLFNNRVLFSYYEMVYVYSLRTQTWTTWRSDVWGPIGQLLMPYVDDDTDIAYALPSGVATPKAIDDRNLVWNPTFRHNTDNTFRRQMPGLGPIVRVTNIPGAGHCAAVSSSSPTLSGISGMATGNSRVSPGESLTLSGRVRSTRPGTFSVEAEFVGSDGAEGVDNGTVLGKSSAGSVSGGSDTWHDVSVSVDVPDGAAYVRLVIGLSGPVSSGSFTVYADNLKIGKDATYFDGNTPDTTTNDYAWSGEPDRSPSLKYLNSSMPLLKIEDRLTNDAELMTCSIQTKNYNFDVPGAFKVLFWWGVDAIFKTNIQGRVVPGVYAQATTWGQVLTKTWGQLLSGTWAHPYLADPSVVSDVVTGAGPLRKFVKFFKKLRFRQIYFQISFSIDGSSNTAPVQIFTLSTYMAEKETVSKTVS